MSYANETGLTKHVMVVGPNNGPAAAGSHIADLAHKQLGLLNVGTGVFAGSANATDQYQLILGVDANGDGAVDNLLRTPFFKKSDVIEVTKTTASAGTDEQWLIHGYKAKCGDDCKLTLEIKNGELAAQFGQSVLKTYNLGDGCAHCDEGDCNEITKAIVELINGDPDGLVKAVPVRYDSENGQWVEINDLDSFIETNKSVNTDDNASNDVCSGVRLIPQRAKVKDFCVKNNFNYAYEVIAHLNIVATGCFECGNITIEQEQAASGVAGSYLEIKTWEAEAEPELNGFESSERILPTGEPNRRFPYLAEPGKSYDVYDITIRGNEAVDGHGPWVTHVVVAIPSQMDQDDAKTAYENLINSLK